MHGTSTLRCEPTTVRPKAASDEPALAVDGVSVVTRSAVVVLDDVSFTVVPGEFTGLIGSNGAGKTTLAARHPRSAAADPGPGTRHRGRRAQKRSSAMCPRRCVLDPDLPMRARDLVELGVDGSDSAFRLHPKVPARRAEEMLGGGRRRRLRRGPGRSAVGWRAAAGPHRPRPGQQAAGASARRALGQPRPAQRSTRSSLCLHRVAKEQGVAVLLSAHEMNTLLPAMDRVVYLAGGRAASGTTDEVVRSRGSERALRPSRRRGATPRPRPRGGRPGNTRRALLAPHPVIEVS